MNLVIEPNVRENRADAMLSELLDVKSRRLTEQANAFRGKFDPKIAQASPGAGKDTGFEFLFESREVESRHNDLRMVCLLSWRSLLNV